MTSRLTGIRSDVSLATGEPRKTDKSRAQNCRDLIRDHCHDLNRDANTNRDHVTMNHVAAM